MNGCMVRANECVAKCDDCDRQKTRNRLVCINVTACTILYRILCSVSGHIEPSISSPYHEEGKRCVDEIDA